MSNPNIIPWTEQNVETLRELWKKGESAAFIAKQLGCTTGRLAVIGKAKRLKLGPHPHAIGKAKASAAKHKREVRKMAAKMEADGSLSRYKAVGPVRHKKPPKPPVVIEKIKERLPSIDGPVMPGDFRFMKSEAWNALPGSNPVPLVDLQRHQCSWPLGDGPFLFCALPTIEGNRYCDAHTHLSKPRT